MKKFMTVLLAASMLLAAGCTQKGYDLAAEEGDVCAGTVPTISVTGTGKLEAAPDTANRKSCRMYPSDLKQENLPASSASTDAERALFLKY